MDIQRHLDIPDIPVLKGLAVIRDTLDRKARQDPALPVIADTQGLRVLQGTQVIRQSQVILGILGTLGLRELRVTQDTPGLKELRDPALQVIQDIRDPRGLPVTAVILVR